MDARTCKTLTRAAEIIARAIELESLDALSPLGEVAEEMRRLSRLRDHQPITRHKLASEMRKLGAMLRDTESGCDALANRLMYLSDRVEVAGVVDDRAKV